MRRVNRVDGQAGDLLLPPLGDRPRAAARSRASTRKTRFRHYLNLQRTERGCAAAARLRWGRVDEVFLIDGELPSSRGRGVDRAADRTLRVRRRAGRRSRRAHPARHDAGHVALRPEPTAPWSDRRSERADLPVGSRDRVPRRSVASWRATTRGCGALGRLRPGLPAGDVLPSRRLAADHRDVFRHRTHFLLRRARRRDRRRAAAGAGEEPAVRQRAGLAAVRRLRRRGGANDEAAAALEVDARELARRARRRPPRVAQRRRRGTPTGRRRTSTSPSARRSCPTSRPTCWPSRASSGRWCARASRTGCAASSTPTPERFFALYADNVHRHGTPPYSRRYFEALQREFGGDCEVLTVEDSRRPAAVAAC